MVISLLKAYKI